MAILKMDWQNPTQLIEPKFYDPDYRPRPGLPTNDVTDPEDPNPEVHDYANIDEQMWGLDNNDKIYGNGGNDFLYGSGGDDFLYGGTGDDVLHGMYDNDILDGSDGNDLLIGHSGNDKLYGGDGNDFLFSGAYENDPDSEDKDELYGGAGSDYLDSGQGDDHLDGGSGDDQLWAGSGNDTLIGGTGNDVLVESGVGLNHMVGGTGIDQYYHEFGGVDESGNGLNEGLTYIYETGLDSDYLKLTDRTIDQVNLAQSGNDLLIYANDDLSDGYIDTAVIMTNFFVGEEYQVEFLIDQNNNYFDLDSLG